MRPNLRTPSTLPAGLDRAFQTALVLIPLGVLGNIAYTLLATDRAALAAIEHFPIGYLALAAGLGLFPWIPSTLRLLVWTRFLGLGIGVRDAVRMTLVVDLGSAVSLTAVGGDVFRWGMLMQRGVAPGTAASLSILSKIEDAAFFAIAVPAAFIATASWKQPAIRWLLSRLPTSLSGLAALAAALVCGALLLRWLLVSGRLGERARRTTASLTGRVGSQARRFLCDARAVFARIGRRGKARLLLTIPLAGLQWTARYSVVTALFAFLGAPVDPVLFWLLQWVTFTIMSFVPTPGAVGGAEAAFTLLYAPLAPAGTIGLVTAAWRFLTFYLQAALAAILFLVPLTPDRGSRRLPGSGGSADRSTPDWRGSAHRSPQ